MSTKIALHEKMEKDYRKAHLHAAYSDPSAEFFILNPYPINPYPDNYHDISEVLCANALILLATYYYLTYVETDKHTRRDITNFLLNSPSNIVSLKTLPKENPNSEEYKILFLKFYKLFELFPEELRNKVKATICMHYMLLQGQ